VIDLETKKMGHCMLLKPLNKSIDSTVSTDFKSRVVDLIKQGNNHFLLNLSNVNFVDSSGLGAMISIMKTLALNNGKIVFCQINDPVMNLLDMTSMNKIFKICSDETAGMEILAIVP
jgi:anti-sigma B factor antagonist